MRGSGEGPLPPGWAWASLRELGLVISGTVRPDPKRKYELWSVPSFTAGRPEILSGRNIGSAKIPVRPGDLLICKINPRINRVWIVGPSSGLPQLASPEWVVLRVPESFPALSAYLRHACAAPHFRVAITAEVSGVTGSHTRVRPATVLSLPVPIPPAREQARIVDALEELLTQLDVAVGDLGRTSRKLTATRDRLLSRFLTRSDESTTTIGEIATVGSGATPLKSNRAYYDGGDVPWITSADLNAGVVTAARQFITQQALQETSVKLWPAGTLLVAMYGEGQTRGRCARLDVAATTNQACAAIALRADSPVTPEFLHMFLDASYARTRRLSAGGVQPNLSLGLVRGIKVPLRSVEAQRELVVSTRAALERLGLAQQGLTLLTGRCETLRRSLLSTAVAGRLVRQEPSDEAADLLLKRIAEESIPEAPIARHRRRQTMSRAFPTTGASEESA